MPERPRLIHWRALAAAAMVFAAGWQLGGTVLPVIAVPGVAGMSVPGAIVPALLVALLGHLLLARRYLASLFDAIAWNRARERAMARQCRRAPPALSLLGWFDRPETTFAPAALRWDDRLASVHLAADSEERTVWLLREALMHGLDAVGSAIAGIPEYVTLDVAVSVDADIGLMEAAWMAASSKAGIRHRSTVRAETRSPAVVVEGQLGEAASLDRVTLLVAIELPLVPREGRVAGIAGLLLCGTALAARTGGAWARLHDRPPDAADDSETAQAVEGGLMGYGLLSRLVSMASAAASGHARRFAVSLGETTTAIMIEAVEKEGTNP
ncbi:hypothetical protein [Luteibacter sp.]|jgi:hypothetical protein|uniref:hypothetical protein n=1 Tax=Luteibacter sp. TaxID=1886636 RepID=UPI002F3F4DB9